MAARDLEGILDVLDLEPRRLCGLEQDHVEPTGPVHPMALSKKLGGQPNEFLLFLPVHGMDRTPEMSGSPRLDLNEHEHVAILCHEVQFSQRGSEVSGHDAVALSAQVAFCLRLSFLLKEPPGVKNCHALVRGGPAV